MFTIENGTVRANPETLCIHPYSLIWSRDDSSHKERANSEFKFIEFYCSPKKTNPFFGYTKGELRSQKLSENIRKTYPEFHIDTLILEGVEQYEEFWINASPSLAYYESNLIAAKQLEVFFNNLDLSKTNAKTGAPIYKPKEITSALADAKTVLVSLNSMREQVYQEIYDASKSKANRPVNPFERNPGTV